MRDIPRYFREQIDEMRAGMRRGFTPPRVTMEGRDASITAVTEATPEASLFYTPFRDMPVVPAAQQAQLRAQAVQTSSARWCSRRTRELLKFMRTEYVPGHAHHARRRGSCRTGKTTIAPRSANSPRSTWSPQAIHELGVAEVQRLHGEMLERHARHRLQRATSRPSSSSCAPTRAFTRRRPRSC